MNDVASGPVIDLSRFGNCTLPGLMEYFLSAEASSGGVAPNLWRGQRVAPRLNVLWTYLRDVWSGKRTMNLEVGAQPVPSVEFFRLASPELVVPGSIQNLTLFQFEKRLVAAGEASGLQKDFAYSLASVMHELVENVFQHSLFSGREHFQGVAAYHFKNGFLSFYVGDLGVGTLQSLRSSSAWQDLKNDREALEAIIKKRASRKLSLGPGEGFNTVFKNLADRNTSVCVRTGDTSVRIRGVNGERHAEWSASHALRGLQVSVLCALRGNVTEPEMISVDSITGSCY